MIGAGGIIRQEAPPLAAPLWRFVVPSLFGILFFLVPVSYDGRLTIVMGALSDASIAALKPWLGATAAGLTVIAAVMSALATFLRPAWLARSDSLRALFAVSHGWLALRITGAVVAVMILGRLGPEWIYGPATGGTILNDLAVIIIVYFFFAGILLPFLTHYGLMEFIGVLVRGFFRRVFALPGRSSIDAVASWMGSAPVGVLITIQQYESGYYSGREAAVIATNFSVVSTAFCAAIAGFMGIGHMFVPFYLTVVVAGLIAAVITPRLPPLSSKRDAYSDQAGRQIDETVPAGQSSFGFALRQARQRAAFGPGLGRVLKIGLGNAADIWFGLLPAVMAVGTFALVIATYTPLFNWLAVPFEVLLRALRIPESGAAAPAMLIGFADQFLPAIIGKSIDSEMTRFVVACISVTQLIYMSELGVLLLKSPIPLGLRDLAAIFLIRTLIVLPVIAAAAHWLY